MRYFLDLAYKGTNYHGWQIQKNASSVQETINNALYILLQQKIDCTGSGRTDTGVHALQQIAHFETDGPLDLPDFQYKLNVLLPSDIAINSIRQVQEDAHARFDAIRRSYHYCIHTKKDPFKVGYSYFYSQPINVSLIHDAMRLLKGAKDFKAFSKVKTDVKTFECEIFDMSWETSEVGHRLVVSADRFLRGMVRALVGTLLDVGLSKTSLEDLRIILKSGDRSMAGRAAPPEGLFLTKVDYPAKIYI